MHLCRWLGIRWAVEGREEVSAHAAQQCPAQLGSLEGGRLAAVHAGSVLKCRCPWAPLDWALQSSTGSGWVCFSHSLPSGKLGSPALSRSSGTGVLIAGMARASSWPLLTSTRGNGRRTRSAGRARRSGTAATNTSVGGHGRSSAGYQRRLLPITAGALLPFWSTAAATLELTVALTSVRQRWQMWQSATALITRPASLARCCS